MKAHTICESKNMGGCFLGGSSSTAVLSGMFGFSRFIIKISSFAATCLGRGSEATNQLTGFPGEVLIGLDAVKLQVIAAPIP